MDQVVQQTASSSEELAATAEQLSAQATKLVDVIGFFKTETAQGERHPSVSVPKRATPIAPRAAKAIAGPAPARPTAITPAQDTKDSDFEEF
jgi:methyl-accepting chemotaxis protein